MELLIKKIVQLIIVCGVYIIAPSVLIADLEDIEESPIPEDEPFLIQEQNKIKNSNKNQKKEDPVLKQDKSKDLIPPIIKGDKKNKSISNKDKHQIKKEKVAWQKTTG